MRTSIVFIFIALTASATAALGKYDSNHGTEENIVDYSFEDHHQERKLSNLFSTGDDNDEQEERIALNIFDVDSGDDEEQEIATRNKREWKCRVRKRFKKCRRGRVEQWRKRKKKKCCRNWPPPDVEVDGSKPAQRPTKRPTKKPSKPNPQPRPTKRPSRPPTRPTSSECKVPLFGQCTTDKMCCEGTCEPFGEVTSFGGFSMFLCCLGGSCPGPEDIKSPSPPTKRPTKKPTSGSVFDCRPKEEFCFDDSSCCSKNCGYICFGSSCYKGCKPPREAS